VQAIPTGGLSHGTKQVDPLRPLQPGQELAPLMAWIGHLCETQTTGLKRSCGSTRVADNSPLEQVRCFATVQYAVASVLVMPFLTLITKLRSMKDFREFVKTEISDAYFQTIFSLR
jgi:hypothetical protein